VCTSDGHPDLPRPTAKGPGWIGRTLLGRLHLRALVLQWWCIPSPTTKGTGPLWCLRWC